MLEKIRKTVEENSDSLDLLSLLFAGFFFFNVNTFPDFTRVIGIIVLVFCFIQISYKLLKRRWEKLEVKYSYIATSFFLIVSLIPTLLRSNINSASFSLSFIMIIFAIRYILYNFYLWSWRKQEGEPNKKRWNASFVSYMLIYFVFGFFLLPIGVLSYKIGLLFLVYAIYDFTKIKYLSTVEEKNKKPTSVNAFSAILDVDYIAWIIVLSLFMLYNFNIFNLDKQTLYYFYSSTAQVFSALLGIVVMFGILILQDKREVSKASEKIFLKKGLIGFSFLYIIVIMLSLSGVLITNDIFQENDMQTFNNYDPVNIQNIIDMGVYEMTFLMIPVSLLYLFALVTEFLKLDSAEETEYQKTFSDY